MGIICCPTVIQESEKYQFLVSQMAMDVQDVNNMRLVPPTFSWWVCPSILIPNYKNIFFRNYVGVHVYVCVCIYIQTEKWVFLLFSFLYYKAGGMGWQLFCRILLPHSIPTYLSPLSFSPFIIPNFFYYLFLILLRLIINI